VIFLKTSHNAIVNFVLNFMFTLYISIYFFPKPRSYPIKIIEKFGTNFVTRLWGLFASPMLISEKEKNKYKKTCTCFLLTYAQPLTAAPVTVTYNDKGGREKRE
jgi:hypothetical protein